MGILRSSVCVLLAIAPLVAYGVPGFTTRMLPLPGGGDAGIYLDYIAYDPGTGFVWVPAGNTGAVDVIDTATAKIKQLSGFPTAEMGSGDRKRVVGPSSVTIGKGTVYVGNRADSNVCAIGATSLKKGTCQHLDSMPDGLAFVASTNEVWVTTPRDKSLRVLDGKTLAEKVKLTYEGNPEGFAVDGTRGRFYTNLEDKDQTLAIDLRTHETVATWQPACGTEGPHGIRIDEKPGFLFVACSTRTVVLDVGRTGKVLSSVDTGDGVDDIDYASSTHLLYVGAAKAGTLTIARVDEHGTLTTMATVPTHQGARNGVVVADGSVYLAHSALGGLRDLVVVAPAQQ
jgi:DNA-binding beta-propeller fold protein YncE